MNNSKINDQNVSNNIISKPFPIGYLTKFQFLHTTLTPHFHFWHPLKNTRWGHAPLPAQHCSEWNLHCIFTVLIRDFFGRWVWDKSWSPMSFFSNQIQIDQLEKKYVERKILVYEYTPLPPPN